MLTMTPDADIRKDGCHSIYMNISKYQSCLPEYECDIFCKKKIWYIRVFTIFCHCPSVQKWFSIFLWKLICCNINRRHIFLVLNLSLCNHNSGWMSCLISFIYGFSPSCEKWEAQSSKWKYVPPPGIEPATPCFPACRSNHLAIGTVNDRL